MGHLRRRTTLLLTATLLAATACGAPDGAGPMPPPTRVPSGLRVDGGRSDLADEQRVRWSIERRTRTELVIAVMTGDPRCLDVRVVVEETPAELRVSAFEGTVPGAPEVCTLVGRRQEVRVATPPSAADKPVVDAASGATGTTSPVPEWSPTS